ncbi:MAG: sulfatase-like hydrolase/transferase, partial [Akkermansiaceae bacterium]
SDDHRHDLIGASNPLIQTPHLDKLAKSGVRFTHACVTTSICSPSRAAVLSGQYGSRNGVPTLSDPLNFPHATIAHTLAKVGYRTTHIGKWHLGTTPQDAGFQQFARINSNGSWFNRKINSNIPGAPTKLNGTFYETVMADLVIERVNNHLSKHADEPFFIWWCNQVPHVDGGLKYRDVKVDPSNKSEHTPPGTLGGYRANYDLASMPVPANWSDNLASKPPYLAPSRFVTKSATENYGGPGGYTNPAPGSRNSTQGEDNVQQHNLEYLASISALDAEIGRVLNHLEDPNGDGDKSDSITGNTWIIFMGDNGWQTGSHKFTSKVLAYEESIRVPLLIKGPGLTPRTESKLTLNIDLPPFFRKLAGLEPAPHHQGLNLKSLLDDPNSSWRDDFYYEATKVEPSLGAQSHDAIRTKTHKLIRTYDKNHKLVIEELYDLTADPGELINLASNPVHLKTKTTLTDLLLTRRKSNADSPDPPKPKKFINGSFDTGDKTGWITNKKNSASVVPSPLGEGSHALRFNTGSASSWVQQANLSLQDFTVTWRFRYSEKISSRVMNVQARSNNKDCLNIRINPEQKLQFHNGSDWTTPIKMIGSNNFLPDTTYLFTLKGTAWGNTESSNPEAGSYTLSWKDLGDDSTTGSFSSITQPNQGYRYAAPNTLKYGEFQGLKFLDEFGDESDPAWLIDNVSITK